MQNISDVVMSPSGENVYVSSIDKDAIAAFDRNPSTGELTQKGTITGCITSTGSVATSDTCDLVSNNSLVDVRAMAIKPRRQEPLYGHGYRRYERLQSSR